MGKKRERAGVTYPEGFSATGLSSGIKDKGVNDLSLIFSEEPCTAAAVFTTNQFKSHSVILSTKNLKNSISAIFANSGNANACNGQNSYRDTVALTKELSGLLDINDKSILVASTGSIGVPLPYRKIFIALPELVRTLSENRNKEAALGITTTDTFIKQAQFDTRIKGRKKDVHIGGMAKGAGMINPSMATMLAFITTDAKIDKSALQAALNESVEDSFNMITVDNDNSTNDTVFCIANGKSKNKTIKVDTPDFQEFKNALKGCCIDLAKMIASDGEGATKLIEVSVEGAWSVKDARRVAKRVAGSNLIKSAIYGGLPGWGRMLASAGSTSAKIDVKRTEISICGITVYRGEPVQYDATRLSKMLNDKEITVVIDIKKGIYRAVAWGCDLTEGYVEINKE